MKKTLRLGALIEKDGVRGMVAGSDSEGNLVVHWKNNAVSRLTPGEGGFKVVTDGHEKVREEILELRQSGVTNMLDLPAVQKYSRGFGYKTILALLAHDRKAYIHFIFTGEFQ